MEAERSSTRIDRVTHGIKKAFTNFFESPAYYIFYTMLGITGFGLFMGMVFSIQYYIFLLFIGCLFATQTYVSSRIPDKNS